MLALIVTALPSTNKWHVGSAAFCILREANLENFKQDKTF